MRVNYIVPNITFKDINMTPTTVSQSDVDTYVESVGMGSRYIPSLHLKNVTYAPLRIGKRKALN